ncbi:hypothetical protein HanRHA438_Chr14g0666631 [Helianthus annuus]|uniref:Uncharacterized protein n=1 Tax=Helianthus annuus TaxID=4232 RepID=A0A251SN82_HELAN|nr:hypothetical protein HanXRQr2_Chr14g0655671 [Helianthus annuus]KAJ0465048.1 hypothetical protein HanHA300_Chr14g0534061 [Helianthus annuus]KAJ0469763.1 hypothetical protein HanIR_Chr14g0711441 [Helianthus annuus]KAJ0486641.1 hypothetical protein HanHA89_Chr14g0581871 [Helianthus annuus]KAJ0657213.1 hypothetical protein HanLR1_Chr14g0544521 [Helianthus annuus]
MLGPFLLQFRHHTGRASAWKSTQSIQNRSNRHLYIGIWVRLCDMCTHERTSCVHISESPNL